MPGRPKRAIKNRSKANKRKQIKRRKSRRKIRARGRKG
jgi:hypothetical protein